MNSFGLFKRRSGTQLGLACNASINKRVSKILGLRPFFGDVEFENRAKRDPRISLFRLGASLKIDLRSFLQILERASSTRLFWLF